MLLDFLNAGSVLGGDAQSLPLMGRAIVGHPDVHDAVTDDDVRGPGVNPRLFLELGEQPLTDSAITDRRIGGQLAPDGGERAHQVCATDDADEPAVLEDGDSLDSFRLEHSRDFGEVGRIGDRDDVARHHVPRRAAMRLDIIAGKLLVGSGRRSVPVSTRCSRSPSLTIPTNRLSASTTGTPLMPRSERTFATSCTDASGVTVITLVVITSIARIGSSSLLISCKE